mgnify:CR=1 FL=1
MSTLSLHLSDTIYRHVKEIAEKEGISIDQFISSAISEKISAIGTENEILERSKKANLQDFEKILKKVPDRKPLPGDEI